MILSTSFECTKESFLDICIEGKDIMDSRFNVVKHEKIDQVNKPWS